MYKVLFNAANLIVCSLWFLTVRTNAMEFFYTNEANGWAKPDWWTETSDILLCTSQYETSDHMSDLMTGYMYKFKNTNIDTKSEAYSQNITWGKNNRGFTYSEDRAYMGRPTSDQSLFMMNQTTGKVMPDPWNCFLNASNIHGADVNPITGHVFFNARLEDNYRNNVEMGHIFGSVDLTTCEKTLYTDRWDHFAPASWNSEEIVTMTFDHQGRMYYYSLEYGIGMIEVQYWVNATEAMANERAVCTIEKSGNQDYFSGPTRVAKAYNYYARRLLSDEDPHTRDEMVNGRTLQEYYSEGSYSEGSYSEGSYSEEPSSSDSGMFPSMSGSWIPFNEVTDTCFIVQMWTATPSGYNVAMSWWPGTGILWSSQWQLAPLNVTYLSASLVNSSNKYEYGLDRTFYDPSAAGWTPENDGWIQNGTVGPRKQFQFPYVDRWAYKTTGQSISAHDLYSSFNYFWGGGSENASWSYDDSWWTPSDLAGYRWSSEPLPYSIDDSRHWFKNMDGGFAVNLAKYEWWKVLPERSWHVNYTYTNSETSETFFTFISSRNSAPYRNRLIPSYGAYATLKTTAHRANNTFYAIHMQTSWQDISTYGNLDSQTGENIFNHSDAETIGAGGQQTFLQLYKLDPITDWLNCRSCSANESSYYYGPGSYFYRRRKQDYTNVLVFNDMTGDGAGHYLGVRNIMNLKNPRFWVEMDGVRVLSRNQDTLQGNFSTNFTLGLEAECDNPWDANGCDHRKLYELESYNNVGWDSYIYDEEAELYTNSGLIDVSAPKSYSLDVICNFKVGYPTTLAVTVETHWSLHTGSFTRYVPFEDLADNCTCTRGFCDFTQENFTMTCDHDGLNTQCSHCLDGWVGDDCLTVSTPPTPPCDEDPCFTGTCIEILNGTDYVCSCPAHYTGHCDELCPPGYACPADATAAELCVDGTYAEGAAVTCTACPAGSYCPDGSHNASLLCAAGFYCPRNSRIANPAICPVGHYCPVGTGAPIPCEAGSRQNETQQTSCDLCPVDTYNDAAGSVNCTSCGVGFYTIASGSNTAFSCLNIDDCGEEPCTGQGTCKDKIETYTCNCFAGYTGVDCEIELDECESDPCSNGATCNDELNDYTCVCADNFYGPQCTSVSDACALYDTDPCDNGVCLSAEDGESFSCDCDTGYIGDLCEIDEDNCAEAPCKYGGTCTDLLDDFSCECVAGYEGDTCATEIDECASSPCQNGACEDLLNDFTCDCFAGYTGDMCETDINECGPAPCEHGGTCTDLVAAFSCACVAGYTGASCVEQIDECESDPCLNAATCVDLLNDFSCECVPGYTGDICQTDIDNCAVAPCENGATCNDQVNAFDCDCVPGYEGITCQTDIDECAFQPCVNGGLCLDGINGFTCDCLDGWTGETCNEDIDECASSPCSNGACTNGQNLFTCACDPGYGGVTCDVDIDECAQFTPCVNGASCNDLVNAYSCSCLAGYTGPVCEINIDDCTDGLCQNGGTCTDLVNSYSCTCKNGYTGTDCETDIDDCEGVTCENSGTCVDLVGDYVCSCNEGFFGKLCDLSQDNCADDPCTADSTQSCVSLPGVDYECLCIDGYTGGTCDVDIDECASDPCDNNGVCSTPNVDGFECACPVGFGDATCSTIYPAPVVESIRVGDSFRSISITFDIFTDTPTISWCDEILPASFLNLLTSGSFTVECYWASPAVLTVFWDAETDLLVGSAYDVVIAGVVRDSSGFSDYTQSQNVTLLAPLNPPEVVSVISAPTFVPSCGNILLDSSGSVGGAGRTFTLSWSVLQHESSLLSANEVALINAHLENFNELLGTPDAPSIQIPDSIAPPGETYVFLLESVSWLGNTDTSNVTVYKDTMEPPLLSSEPENAADYFLVSREDGFTITMIPFLAHCLGATTFEYSWEQLEGTSYYLPAQVQSSATLYIPPNILIPNDFYVFRFNVTSRDRRGLEQYIHEDVRIKVSPVRAPELTSASLEFDIRGEIGSITLEFDSATNRAQMWSGSTCDEILSTFTLSFFPNGDLTCSWIDDMHMTIEWSNQEEALVAIGSEIRIIDGVLQTADGLSLYGPIQFVALDAPSVAPTVTAQVTGSSRVGVCTDVQLDASFSSGGAGREFDFSWSLIDTEYTQNMTATDYFLLRTAVQTQERGTFNLDRDLLPPNFVLGVTATVTNWLGVSATSEVFEVTKTLDLFPSAKLVGIANEIDLDRYTDLPYAVVSELSGSGCNAEETLIASWTQVSGPVFDGDLSDPTLLSFAEQSLIPGETYVFKLSVEIEDTGATGDVQLTVNVAAAKVPAIVRAAWSSSLTFFTVYFDAPTSRGLDAAHYDSSPRGRQGCSYLLAPLTLDAIGNRPSCLWISDTQLRVNTGNQPELSAFTAVLMRNDTIRSVDGLSDWMNTDKNADLIFIEFPALLPTVEAKIQSPDQVGSCESIGLDGSGSVGSGGKWVSFDWEIRVSPYLTALSEEEYDVINNYLSEFNEPKIVTNSSLFPDGRTYEFQLTVTNWLGQTATTVRNVFKSSLGLPVLAMSDTAVRSTRADEAFIAIATFRKSTCEEQELGFSWELLSTSDNQFDASVMNQTRYMAQLYIPPFSLHPRESYTFRLVTYVKDKPQLFNTAVVQVVVKGSQLTAKSSMSSGVVSIADGVTLDLDGSDSYDVDDPAEVVPLDIYWTCKTGSTGGLCLSAANVATYITDQVDLSIPTNLFSTDDFYIFTLSVEKDERQSTKELVLSFTTDSVPAVGIELTVRNVTLQTATKIRHSERFMLSGSVTDNLFDAGEYSFEWQSDDLNLTAPGVVRTSVYSKDLVLAPYALVPGQRVVINLRVYSSLLASDVYGESLIIIEANAAPQSGVCTVDTKSGDIVSVFELSCDDWADDAADFPLSFGFFAKKSGEDWTEIPNIGEWQGARSLQALLPMGAAEDDYVVDLKAEIRDRLGADTVVYIGNVTVTPTVAPITSFEELNKRITDALDAGAVNLLSQALFATYSVLDALNISDPATAAIFSEADLAAERLFLLTALVQYNADQPVTNDGLNRQVSMAYSLCNQPAIRFEEVANISVLCAEYMRSALVGSSDLTSTMGQLSLQTTETLKGGARDSPTTNVSSELALAYLLANVIEDVSLGLTDLAVDGEDPVILGTGNMSITALKTQAGALNGAEQPLSDNQGIGYPSNFSAVLEGSVRLVTVLNNDTSYYASFAIDRSNDTIVNNQSVSEFDCAVPIMSVNVYSNSGAEQNVSGLDTDNAFYFTFPKVDINPDIVLAMSEINSTTNFTWLCRYWDPVLSSWSTDGCELANNPQNEDVVVCACTHLTDFGLGQQQFEEYSKPPKDVDEFIPEVNQLQADTIKEAFTFSYIEKHPIPMISTCFIFVVYLILLSFAHLKDKRDFAMRMHMKDKLFLKYPRIMDHLHMSHMDKFKGGLMHFMRNRHKWFSVVLYDPSDAIEGNYTGKERLTVLFCALLSGMVAAALFYGIEQSSAYAQLSVIMITALMIVTFNVVLALFFRKSMDPALAAYINKRIEHDHEEMIKTYKAKLKQFELEEEGGDLESGAVTIHAFASPSQARSAFGEEKVILHVDAFDTAENADEKQEIERDLEAEAAAELKSAQAIQNAYRGHIARRKKNLLKSKKGTLIDRLVKAQDRITTLSTVLNLNEQKEFAAPEPISREAAQALSMGDLTKKTEAAEARVKDIEAHGAGLFADSVPDLLAQTEDLLSKLASECHDTVYSMEQFKESTPENTWVTPAGFEALEDFAERLEVRLEILPLLLKRTHIVARYMERLGYNKESNAFADAKLAEHFLAHVQKLDVSVLPLLADYEEEFGEHLCWPTLADDAAGHILEQADQFNSIVFNTNFLNKVEDSTAQTDSLLRPDNEPSDGKQDPLPPAPAPVELVDIPDAMQESANPEEEDTKVLTKRQLILLEHATNLEPAKVKPFPAALKKVGMGVCIAWMITAWFLIVVYASQFSEAGTDADAIALLWLTDLTLSSLMDVVLLDPVIQCVIVLVAMALRTDAVKLCVGASPALRKCLKSVAGIKIAAQANE